MAVKIKLIKNNIPHSQNYGLYQAKAVSQGEVSVSDLAQEIKRNGISQGTMEGIIIDLERIIRQKLADGKTVVIPRLGRFSLRVESDSVEDSLAFSIQQNIRRVVCRFLPAGTRDHQRNGAIRQLLAEDVAVEWQKGEKPKK